MRNSLNTTGLSLSQAQSISNLCFQRTQDISSNLSVINNAEKTLKIGNETYVETVGNKMPANVVDLLLEKALLHATQAFLMENIKAKDSLLKELKDKYFISPLTEPDFPITESITLIPLVNEKWGWDQLSLSEYNEYLEAEAYAAHIGQFIHKDCKLDILRKELSTIKTLEWMTIKDGEKTPLKVSVHHNQAQLLDIHNNLAALHRKYEQRVNYFKAKVKNLVTEENARISKVNADEQAIVSHSNRKKEDTFSELLRVYRDENLRLVQDFEKTRQEDIQKVAGLRITVDTRFQPTVDKYLKELE
jgi:hypothetical protein